jgi:hypothetical protein
MGILCDVFQCNQTEQKIIDYARTGRGCFSESVVSMSFERSEAGHRQGYFDVFKVELDGRSDPVHVHLPVMTCQKLYRRDIPLFVRHALEECFEQHSLDNPESAYHKRQKPAA